MGTVSSKLWMNTFIFYVFNKIEDLLFDVVNVMRVKHVTLVNE